MVTSFRMVEWESIKLIPKAPRHYSGLMLHKLDQTLRREGGSLIVYGLHERAEEMLRRLTEAEAPRYPIVKTAEELDEAVSRSIAMVRVASLGPAPCALAPASY